MFNHNKVESTLFRVHEYQLTKSETFSDMFNMPKDPTTRFEEGAFPEHPIVLSTIKASDFEALLKVLYADYFPDNKFNCEPDVVVSALRLAHMWNFLDLRSRLLPVVERTLKSADRIALARELGIQVWLVPAYMELCQREESLTTEEGTKLGMHSTIMITRLRDQFRPAQWSPYSGCPGMYCKSCAGVSYGSFGARSCDKCDSYMETYYNYTKGPPSADPFEAHEELPTQVKEWVEGGCVTD